MYSAVRLLPPLLAWDTERGATSVEYALMIVLIALAVFGAGTALGFAVVAIFQNADLNGALS